MVRMSEEEKSLIRELSARHNHLIEIVINDAARDPRLRNIPPEARNIYLDVTRRANLRRIIRDF